MKTYQMSFNLIEEFDEIAGSNNQDLIQENANVDGKSPMGMMGLFASTSAKYYAIEQLLSEEVKQVYTDGYIHIHDLDYYVTGTTTCVQIPLGKVLKDGFDTGHGHMREPNSILSAMALASIIFQSNQNQQHGGQAMSNFDFDLAPYVYKTYEKNVQLLKNLQANCDIEEKAWELTDREVFQACEAFIHNSNSMHSRGGGQVPFISINYGLDTSKEGRMLVKNMLLATQKGLGNGETPIFPIQIFKVKEGINLQQSDVNYDLFRLSLETTAKRLFPNYVFVDAPFNLQYFQADDPETHIATMGCRTRVLANVNGKSTPVGRGNLSFTSINLPLIALESDGIEAFWGKLDHYIDIACQQLLERFDYQSCKTPIHFKFLYGQGIWRDAAELHPSDTLEDVLKQGTLSVGYVGLAEALVALIGKHHGESDEAQALGLRIISYMREKMDAWTKKMTLNFTLLATPAESYAGKALKMTRKKHGVIEGVTDKEWFTNSNHVPVEYQINAIHKIKKEAPYHALTNAGHITYVELAEDASKNIDALETYVLAMKENGIGYGSFNVPVDRCLQCGYNGVIYNECPKCQTSEEQEIERIRRITGYLVGSMDKWNGSKRNEEQNRVKHGRGK
ncbi:anaerobic ribonucleoside triphosphate reductase [Sporosarcina sp. HYO08]|uniref:anaerobic ribonucleoside triphosphate reductase n=1 Tax=Sporosarcina sp. HYO08 TaxID=1759557 RepID=UPI000793C552|nr:anaerobic ribonucleoside triphosphate reductase [Sporosarcina sp. HYO08]KXH81703.1 anaerobic ribonucleoside-triphosphate reductase [Sporosarcina sp. HYO08]